MPKTIKKTETANVAVVPEPRSGSCALIGQPNVGKSTLLNALLGQKLAITAPTPQTTRATLLGIFEQHDPPTQIAFMDTPGLHKPANTIGRRLHEEAKGAMVSADVVALLIDGSMAARKKDLHPEDRRTLQLLADSGKPVLLVVNKVDRLKNKADLLPLLQHLHASYDVKAVIPISALRGTQLTNLIGEIRSFLAPGLAYEGADITDRSVRFLVAEFVREAAILYTKQEVPHGLAVEIDNFDEKQTLTRIDATIFVNKENHKKILIGTQGSNLKNIGTHARQSIEELLGTKVMLKLWVKVLAGWTSSDVQVKRLVP